MPNIAVWLVTGYALCAVIIAWSFDAMAKYTSQRANQWHNGEFTYHPQHDAWMCPQDQWLWPQSVDMRHRIVLYQAESSICHNCPVKSSCTQSDSGRIIHREIDPWPYSEAGRFHRGISCIIAFIAGILPVVALVFFHSFMDIVILLLSDILCVMLSMPLARHLWNTPANFPVPYLGGVTEKGI